MRAQNSSQFQKLTKNGKINVKLANEYFEAKNIKLREIIIQRYSEILSNSIRTCTIYKQYPVKYESRDFKSVAEHLDRILSLAPISPELKYKRSEFAWELKDYAKFTEVEFLRTCQKLIQMIKFTQL